MLPKVPVQLRTHQGTKSGRRVPISDRCWNARPNPNAMLGPCDPDYMWGEWRRWLPGPKHGIARGAVVWGPDGAVDPADLFELLGLCSLLRAWADGYGLDLDDGPDSLSTLDRFANIWATEPGGSSALDQSAGHYLGTVIVKHVPGAVWRAWPNGHPVVRLPSGRDLDVIAKATSQPGTLALIYKNASGQ